MRPVRPLIIAIDGPAGAGKSTAARRVAEQLGYRYLDTGAMYRAVALAALREGVDLSDAEALAQVAEAARIELETRDSLTRVWLDGEEVTPEIRAPAVSEAASRVSAVPQVRQAMVRLQRRWGQRAQRAPGAGPRAKRRVPTKWVDAARGGGVVMEGRDIGTVVFPQADVKVFLDASPAERARRRAAELAEQSVATTEKAVAEEMAARDARDSQRQASPLVRAPDAVLIQTDGLTPDQVVERILEICRRRGAEP